LSIREKITFVIRLIGLSGGLTSFGGVWEKEKKEKGKKEKKDRQREFTKISRCSSVVLAMGWSRLVGCFKI
jgi:hypothetical protein